MSRDPADIRFENDVVIALVQAMLGAVPPIVTEIYVEANVADQSAQVFFLIEGSRAAPWFEELVEEIVDDAALLLHVHHPVRLESTIVRVDQHAVPAERRVVYRRWQEQLGGGSGSRQAIVFRPDAWTGDSYSLAIALGPADDDRALRALTALWSFPSIDGCYLDPAVEVDQQTRVAVSDLPDPLTDGARGVATVPGSAQVPCLSSLLREDGGNDWLYFDLPLGGLCAAYPVEMFPGPCRDTSWRKPLDEWLRELAAHIAERVPFLLAAIGWSQAQEVFRALEHGIPGQRFVGFVVPGPDGLSWHPPTDYRDHTLRNEASAIALAVRNGLLEPEDLRDWVQAVIERQVVPDPLLIAAVDREVAIERVEELAGDFDPDWRAAILAHVVAEQIRLDPIHVQEIASNLWDIAYVHQLPPGPLADAALWALDAFSQADAGEIPLSRDQVRLRLLDACEKAAESATFDEVCIDAALRRFRADWTPAPPTSEPETEPEPARSQSWAAFDAVRIPAGPGKRKTAARDGHLLAVEHEQGIVLVLDRKGRPNRVRSMPLAELEHTGELRMIEDPIDAEEDFALSVESAKQRIEDGTAEIAQLEAAEGANQVTAQWQRVRDSEAPQSGAADGAWLLLRLGDRILPLVHRTPKGFQQCGTLFLSARQLERVLQRGVPVRDLGCGWSALEFPAQPFRSPIDFLIGPSRDRALSLSHLATAVIEAKGNDTRPLALPSGPELTLSWQVIRITGYGAVFGYTIDGLMMKILHRGKPLTVVLEGLESSESFRTDRSWLDAVKRAAKSQVGDNRWKLRIQGRATTSLGTAAYGQIIEIDLTSGTVLLRTSVSAR